LSLIRQSTLAKAKGGFCKALIANFFLDNRKKMGKLSSLRGLCKIKRFGIEVKLKALIGLSAYG